MLSGLATFLSYHPIRESLHPTMTRCYWKKKKKGKHASSRRGMVFVQKPLSKPSRDITSLLKCLTPTRSTPLVSEAEKRGNILNPLALLKAKLLFKSPQVDLGRGAITDFISWQSWFLNTLRYGSWRRCWLRLTTSSGFIYLLFYNTGLLWSDEMCKICRFVCYTKKASVSRLLPIIYFSHFKLNKTKHYRLSAFWFFLLSSSP